MTAKPATFDEYLAAVSKDKRAALEKLRKAIRAAAPDAEEGISYGLAAFRLDGKPLVAIGATANHCAFYLMSNSTVIAHRDELKGYDTSTGTIRFPVDRPLPTALVRKLVKARMAENSGRVAKALPKTVKKRSAPAASSAPAAESAVTAFLRELDHPLKKDIETVRKYILGASPEIQEGIKWNAPSFHTKHYFATFNLRSRDAVQLIFHTGAKIKGKSMRVGITSDPAGLIQWLAKDRCFVTMGAGKDIKARRSALETLVREWIRQLAND